MSGERASPTRRAGVAGGAGATADIGAGAAAGGAAGPGGRGHPVPAAPAGSAANTMRYGALAAPRQVQVLTTPEGTPRCVELDGRRREVEAVRDDWLVQDLWWTERPVERHYHELVIHPGRIVVVFRDLLTGHWLRH